MIMNYLRKYLLSILLVTSITFALRGEDAVIDKFNEGISYYNAGSYEEALEVWNTLYLTGYRSAELNYNIGNAYFKLNNIPQSILFYERAYLLKPADENINYNLQIARTLVVDRFQEIPELFFVRWYNFVALLRSTNTWAKTGLISFVLCLIFLSLYIYTSRHRYKVIGFWLAVFLLFSSVTSMAFSFRNRSLVLNSQKAIISNPIVNGKSSPDDSGTDLFVLHEGTKVSIEDKVGEWLEIRLSDGNVGWVPVNSLNII